MRNSSPSQEARIISPLRYPGAKRRLVGYISKILHLNSLHPKLFVEPFAGGASVGLQLLNDNLVDKIALGEKDPLIAGFWKTVFKDPKWLIERIEEIDISVENWKYFKENSFRSHRDRALACIYLNRTSFSGILAPGAGPIGGYSQKSEHKIDCRFPVRTIIKRIQQAASLGDRVLFVDNAGWERTIRKVEALGYRRKEVFYYLDPPFYEKAKRLYTHSFQEEEHLNLRDFLVRLRKPWLLSYDPAEPVLKMYSDNGCVPRRIDILYSASAGPSLIQAQEFIITNLPHLPKETKVWRSNNERQALSSGSLKQRDRSPSHRKKNNSAGGCYGK
jgi:DNA adenine methylase